MENFKLTKEEVFSLSDENLIVKKEREILEKISKRFEYIFEKIVKAELKGSLKKCISWFDFSNEGGEGNQGYFDINRYKEDIDFTGESTRESRWMDYYSDSFPTRWLWEDFEEELVESIKKAKDNKKKLKEKKKLDEETKKQIKNKKIETILSKLDDEEKKFVLKNIKK